MKLENLKKQVSVHIANNQLSEALNIISKNDNLFEYSKSSEVILLMGRLTSLKKDTMLGTLSNSNSNLEHNKIVSAILGMLNIKERAVKIQQNESTQHSKVSFSDIKKALKEIKGKNNKIYYYNAIDVLSDLF